MIELSKDVILNWVKELNLDTWGPTEVQWNDEFHRVHIIVGEGMKQSSREYIEGVVAKNIETKVIAADEAEEFLKHLYVTDYAQED
ncbi:hypothetical protein ESZ50_05365 [Weissella muntiaci]|uniref:Uncharacterized protein n=1 Tax=Weissella muntiaci TaxID=2508881 RepID=A0A6C2C6V9_9LACO|nr:hypothetical protein [Weissella muntiaci]TYC49574.1 hypothetical protein ESZ50_05365 [Weissella muntiaci]